MTNIPRIMLKRTIILAAVASLVFPAATAGAQTYTWDADAGTGGNQDGGGIWQVGTPNWDAGGNANQNWTDGNDAVIGVGSGDGGTIAVTGTVNAGTVTLNDPGSQSYTIGGTGTLNTTGNLTKNGSADATLGGTATFNLGGGQINVGKLVIDTTVNVADGKVFRHNFGTELEITGNGSLTAGGAPQFLFGDITLRDNAAFNLYGWGNFELDDGTGSAQPTTMTILDNATFTVDRDGVANGYTATGGINTGGFGGGGFSYGLEWNQYSTVTIDQQGGTVNLTNLIADAGSPWGSPGEPGLVMSHGATGGANADYIDHKYNLRGGVLNVSGIINTSGVVPTGPTAAAGGTGNGFAPIFNFDGGTLRASQSDSDDPGVVGEGWNYLMSNLWHAYVEDGGAIIDTQDFTNSINQALEHDPTLGATPDGGLTKLGSGRLILLQQSTYTGDTTVTDGVLEVMQRYLDDASSVDIADGSMMDLNFQGIDVIDQLFLNGVAQGPGIYDAGTDPDFFAGTGSLQVVQSSLPSDLNDNGFVDFEDLTILLANWNKDVTADDGNLVEPLTTVVNFADLTVLLADWTGPGPAGSPEAVLGHEAVPEPSTLVLALLATVGLSVCRRRRCAR